MLELSFTKPQMIVKYLYQDVTKRLSGLCQVVAASLMCKCDRGPGDCVRESKADLVAVCSYLFTS